MNWKEQAQHHLDQAVAEHGPLMPQHHLQFAQVYAMLAVVEAVENITDDGIGVLVTNPTDIARGIAEELAE